jgi:SP family galactose:H+ symporter-like MFS transporter
MNDHDGRSFKAAIGRLAWVSVSGGLLCGSSLAFVPVYLVLQAASVDCSGFATSTTCATAHGAGCTWIGGEDGWCAYPDEKSMSDRCVNATSKAHCSSISTNECWWSDSACHHRHGFDAIGTGAFTAALLIGAIIGCSAAGMLWGKIGSRRSAFIVACIVMVGTISTAIGAIVDSFGLLVASRVAVGVGVGLAQVVVPLWANEGVGLNHRSAASTVFQAAFQLGIALPASIGAAVSPAAPLPSVPALKAMMCGLLLIPVVCSAALAAIAYCLIQRDKSENRIPSSTDNQLRKWVAAWRCSSFRRAAFVGVVLAAAQQLSGITAIMTYAPTIVHETVGLEKLVGSCVIAWWNMVLSVVAIPIAPKFRKRRLYLSGLGVVSAALLAVGMSSLFLGTKSPAAGRVVSAIGLAVFIGSFQIGMGSLFWTLSAEIFAQVEPREQAASQSLLRASDISQSADIDFKSLGSSWTNTMQLTLAMLLLLIFPSAQEGLGNIGNPSDPTRQGLGALMIVFFMFGAATLVLLARFLHPPETPSQLQSEQSRSNSG